jgi:hypothetical protein
MKQRKQNIHGNGADALTPNLHNTPLIEKVIVKVPDTRTEEKLFAMYLEQRALCDQAYDIIQRLRTDNARFRAQRKAYGRLRHLIGKIPTSHLEKN